MKKYLAMAAAAAAFAASPASADPLLFNYTSLAGPASNFSFILESSPSIGYDDGLSFEVFGVDVNFGGTTSRDNLAFYADFAGYALSDEPGHQNFFSPVTSCSAVVPTSRRSYLVPTRFMTTPAHRWER